jgi:hypothetical protein
MKVEKCDDTHCLLNYLYPNTDASLACDSDCHFEDDDTSWGGKHNLDSYAESYPDIIKKFNEDIINSRKENV